MSRKKQFLWLSLPILLLVLLFSSVAIAENVRIETVSDLLSKKYPIDNYRSYLSTERGLFGLMNGDKIVEAVNGLAEIFFTLTRLIYGIFDYFVKIFYSMDVLGKLSGIVSLLTNNLWQMFRANYATLIIVIALLWVGKTYFMDSPKEALYQFAKIILVLVVSGIWFPRANDYLTKMNNYSFGFQAEIMKVAGSVDATSALSSGGETSTTQATDIMRNELFKQTVYQPFLLVNYGTVNEAKINKMYAKVKDKNVPQGAGADYLLSKQFSKLKDKDKQAVLKKLAKHNKYLTGDKVGYKFVISLISVICLFLYGIPLVGIAFANVFLQLLALILSYLLPIIALISLLPRFSDGLVNSIINVAKVLAAKGLLALVVLMFTLINLTVDLLIAPSSVTTVLANILMKGMIYWLLWKFREPLLRMLTRAVMKRSDMNTVNMRMKQFDHTMNDFGDPRKFVQDFGAASDGNGEHFDDYEDSEHSYDEPETPTYQEDDEGNEQPVELNESGDEETSEKDGEIDVNDKEMDVDDSEEIPVEDTEIPVENVDVPEDIDIPDDIPVEEPADPGEIPVEDPDIESLDAAEPPSTTPEANVSESDSSGESHDHGSAGHPANSQEVEDEINKHIQVYQHNHQHEHDDRTFKQENDYSQHQTATINNRHYERTEENNFTSRLKELKD